MPGTTRRTTRHVKAAALAAASAGTSVLMVSALAIPAQAGATGPGAAGARLTAARQQPATATIEGYRRYQRIAGFGASEAFGEAEVIQNAPAATQRQALSLLYSRTSGAGLTILRNEVRASPGNSIEPAAPASPSAKPSYVPLSALHDDSGQLWLAQQIKARYGVTDVFADAWSAPPFMKTNDSVSDGGTLCGVPGATCASGDWRQAYANYLTQYARDYAKAGVPLSYVGPENEANLAPPYSGMVMSPAQTANFMQYLGPTLASSGLRTRAECCATEGWDYAQQYAAAIESDPLANAFTPLFTSHGYTEAPASPLAGWDKPVWETEWSTFEKWDPAWDDGTDASGLSWAQRIEAGLAKANLSAFLYWWGSSTPTFNGDNESLIQINGTTVTPSGRLWAFASYSRFVRPGAVRIGAVTPDGNLELTAFRNTDGSIAIVALNTGTSAVPVTFSLRGTGTPDGAVVTPYLTDSVSHVAEQSATRVADGTFGATLPARSLVTYVIHPRPHPGRR
jgi:O-glycosyl hydrolase